MQSRPQPWKLLLAAGVMIAGCSTVPYTQRRQLSLVSESQEIDLGKQAFAEVKSKSKISADPAANALVERAGRRIAAVAEKPEYQWEFEVIDDPKMINAFALPGGKVAVYTGLLPVAKDETGLAVVMAHEVAHALARHGAERMSQAMAMGLAETAAAVATGVIKSEAGLKTVEMIYGIGVGLPHSRKQESEADKIGLILMAKAGYDPRAAVGFWERMQAANSGGSKPPEFLSTHPSDDTRIRQIQEYLPEALKYYKP